MGVKIKESKIAEAAQSLFFSALEKGDNFQFRVQVAADTPETAKNMADIVQGLIALGRMSREEGRQDIPPSLIDGIQTKLEGKIVRLELVMPSREIADLTSRGKHLSFLD